VPGTTPAREGPSLAVRELLKSAGQELSLRLAAGRRGLDRLILLSRVQRPGLALTGFTDYIRYGRVQIMGGSEVSYLGTLAKGPRRAALRRLARGPVSCFVVTKGLRPPAELLEEAEKSGAPVLLTRLESTTFIKQLTAFLDDRLALRVHLHAVLMDVFGLGVINIKDLYGVSSIRLSKRIELVVSLDRWEEGREYDRLGLHDERHPILGLEAPLVRMPVAPGRNLALLVEVAARNQLLKARGFDAARLFAENVDKMLASQGGAARGRRRRARAARRA